MLVETRPLWRGLAQTCAGRVHRPLPCRAPASRKGEPIAIPIRQSAARRPAHRLQRAAWRHVEVLSSCRMRFLTKRGLHTFEGIVGFKNSAVQLVYLLL